MDRPELGLVKWSPNPARDSFLHINLQHRVIHLYEPTGHAQKGRFDYSRISKHDDFPTLTTYDWSPSAPGLLAVGTGSGVVNILRVDDNSNAYVELGLKTVRTCQAVAFNSEGLLAVGLDRVRMDQSLNIWDVQRVSSSVKNASGFPQNLAPFSDPVIRLEPTVSVTSIKFFEDNPQTLVVGIKNLGLRLHDLRDSGSVVEFRTKCNNNLSIDFADQNYFASSALDQPGVMIWDRRAPSKPVGSTDPLVSSAYQQAIDEDDLPWGGALRLNGVVDTDHDSSLNDSRHSVIKSLRYCRDHRGLLAVLSLTGQLKILNTQKEMVAPEHEQEGSPELLRLCRSHDMDVTFADTSRKQDKIVSFDWVTLGSPTLRPRLLVLRASGIFEILEQPSPTADHLFKLITWKAPHRGFEDGSPYQTMMQFEPSQAPSMLAPLMLENALSDIPIFGDEKADIESIIKSGLETQPPASGMIYNEEGKGAPLSEALTAASTPAEKLRALRAYAEDIRRSKELAKRNGSISKEVNDTDALNGLSIADNPPSRRELHESLLTSLLGAKALPRAAQCILDHYMLSRAKTNYLFDPETNRKVVDDDDWLRFLWEWIGDAEHAAEEAGMMQHPLDLSYMGVYTIWMNDLGHKASSRLPEGASNPDSSIWERCIGQICKRKRLAKYEGVSTKRPLHRQLCLEICSWGDPESREQTSSIDPSGPTTRHTMATAKALFRGNTKLAVQILKRASTAHPELLFVSLALQLIGRGDDLTAGQLDFDEAVASKTDPYLRAVSSLIATGDWMTIANQKSLPLSDRAFVAFRNLSDDQLTQWLSDHVTMAIETGDIEGIVLTGITDRMVDVFAKYVEKFHDYQTATLVMSVCAPRYVDDYRCLAWRNAYRAYLQRHRAFFQRTKFEVESTKRSKHNGKPTIMPPFKQIALRCVYCDAETTLDRQGGGGGGAGGGRGGTGRPSSSAPASEAAAAITTLSENRGTTPLMSTSIAAGVSCPNCGRHLPRCVVCLEVVGVPRSDRPEMSADDETRAAARFPTFCLRCEHVLHLDHARQWFARHVECPVPECRCRCNFRANPELNY